MGCYTLIHSIDYAQDLDGLARLPRSIEWRLFRSKRHNRLFLDHGFDPSSAWDVERFSDKPNFRDGPGWDPFSLRFDANHDHLNDLVKQGIAEQMAVPVIKYAQKVSAEIRGRVFFSISDDQGHDAVCVAENARVLSLKFCCGEEIIAVDSEGNVTSSPNPFQSEEEGTLMAGLATDESERHFGYRIAWLIESFDPPPDDDEYDLISRSPSGRRRSLSGLALAWDFVRFLWIETQQERARERSKRRSAP